MIPSVRNLNKIPKLYADYLNDLSDSDFSGDIGSSYSDRLLCATDNSVYQSMPYAVIFPKSVFDVQIALKLGYNYKNKGIIFTARGGGTGTNGQSLNKGVIIDMSRYMKKIISIDAKALEANVEVGVIKDELNDALAPYDLFFSPELSTSSRATLGGMISNDAAGQGSLKYGRTSDHVKSLRAVLVDGSVETFGEIKGKDLEQYTKKEGLVGKIYQQIYDLLKINADKVEQIFPKLNRFLTGYDLYHAYNKETDTLNIARLITGAEGTLAVVTDVTVTLTPKPSYRGLLVIKYQDFIFALKHANQLIESGALSVETVDSTVLNLAKKDVVWHQVKDYIQDVEGATIEGINIVEFASLDKDKEIKLINQLYQEVQNLSVGFTNGILGAQIVDTQEGISAVYGMRKKAVGLLGSMASDKKLVAFVEDTVVPPQNLPDYIVEFRALLDNIGVTYGMFGHVDTGLMHVRPALDLTLEEDKQKLLKISDGVANLVQKYQGQMWGEHGRGYRASYAPLFFKELYPVIRQVKEIFDKDNVLNPHKVCVPLHSTEDVVSVNSPMRGDFDKQIPLSVRQSFEGALSCNGNGQCFTYKTQELMCPSYRYTQDHVRSPKGYSSLMREWLRQLSMQGVNVNTLEEICDTQKFSVFNFMKRCFNTIFDKSDYNHEYKKHIQTCVSCKSCKTQCPAHVNAADLNSRFLSMYYTRYLRPSLDLLTLNAEKVIPILSKYPKIVNPIFESDLNKTILKKFFKFVDMPLFDKIPFTKACKQEGFEELSLKKALNSDFETIIVLDPFTKAYDVKGLIAFARLLRRFGQKVAFLRPYVNGKLNVIRGDRHGFIKHAIKQSSRLELLASKGKTLVGYDPALTISYRDEYKAILGKRRGYFEVLLPEELLVKLLQTKEANTILAKLESKLEHHSQLNFYNKPFYLFCHCTENALLPTATNMWVDILNKFKLELKVVKVSCCGMAGLFGHMSENQDESYKTYNKAWKEHIKKYDLARCLITGFSCRQQVQRMEQSRAYHPLDIIDLYLSEALDD